MDSLFQAFITAGLRVIADDSALSAFSATCGNEGMWSAQHCGESRQE